jgi:hypothetical protein
MAVTEAEVKRLLADATGKRLHATRLASLERLRTHLEQEPRKNVSVTAAIDGLLAIAVEAKQPSDVRIRAAEILGQQIDLDAVRARFRTWPDGWTARVRYIARDQAMSDASRLLSIRTIEARVLEEAGLDEIATALFVEILTTPHEPFALRSACLHALGEIHRGSPSFFADERRIGGLVTSPLPKSDHWHDMSDEEKSLAAALVDPAELAELIPKRTAAPEAAAFHVRWDPSSAKLLAERVRQLTLDAEVERRHAELLRVAVEFDRSNGVLALDWIAPAIADVALAAAREALRHEIRINLDEHVRLWIDLFRDGGRGLSDRLLERIRDEDLAPAWIALHSLATLTPERAAEGDRRALALLKKKPNQDRLDVLVGMVVPELALDLQEAGLLPAIDVPTEDELARLYQDDIPALARKIRLKDLAAVVKEVDARYAVALAVLPSVLRWLPSELSRFGSLLGKSMTTIAQRNDRKLKPKQAFDAMLEALRSIPTPVSLLDFARAASIHQLPALALAPFLRPEPELRAFWSALVRSKDLGLERRLDAWNALDAMSWPEKEDELGELAEEILVRSDDSEIGASFIEPFRRRWPVRFATIASRLRISVPPVERISLHSREAIAAAVSADETIETIERGEPVEKLLGALLLVRSVVARRPDLRDRARAALQRRTSDPRAATSAYEAQVALFEEDAVATLARALELGDDLERATELARRFAAAATSPMKAAALAELDRGLGKLLVRPTRSATKVENLLAAYCETVALLGDAPRMRERLHRTMTDRTASAGARYAAFSALEAAQGVDREALLDAAVAMFFDPKEDRALRALLGGVVTIGKPQAFASIVDMNLQPWVVLHADHGALPANSLPANMPMSWLVATLAQTQHDEPAQRAASEIVTRITPAKSWEYARTRTHWLALVKSNEAAVRRGLRGAVHVAPDAARLLALFGEEEDVETLASVAGTQWTEETLADNVFWRPAGKSPAFGRYSFLEPWLEAAFGTQGRYRILSMAYVIEAERAEGGDASRYAYEAFLLDPGSQRASDAMTKFR